MRYLSGLAALLVTTCGPAPFEPVGRTDIARGVYAETPWTFFWHINVLAAGPDRKASPGEKVFLLVASRT